MVCDYYDKEGLPLLILIHGGNSTKEEFDDIFPILEKNFSIWIYTISSHGKDCNNPYTSIYNNAEELLKKVSEKYETCYVYGRALGSQIAIEMALQSPKVVTKIILESPLCVMTFFMKHIFRIHESMSYKPNEEDVKNGKMLSKENFVRMVKDNLTYALDTRVQQFTGDILIFYSQSEDKLIKKSIKMLKTYVQNVITYQLNGNRYLLKNNIEEGTKQITIFLNNQQEEKE